MATDGSTYAIGKFTPDAVSILLIPEITIGNRFAISEYSFFGKIPSLYACLTFSNGFNATNPIFTIKIVYPIQINYFNKEI